MQFPFMLRRTHEAAMEEQERTKALYRDSIAFAEMYWKDYKSKYEELQREFTRKSQELAALKKSLKPVNEDR